MATRAAIASGTFGKPNRPHTPVMGIINNENGALGEAMMKERYDHVKNSNKGTGPIGIRMTNAQMHADAAVRAKNTTQERQPDFKLKRFQNVEPRTSTKRGD